MRMRKSIEEAVKWFVQRNTLKRQRDPNTIINEYHPMSYEQVGTVRKTRSKAIAITVERAYQLTRPSQLGAVGAS